MGIVGQQDYMQSALSTDLNDGMSDLQTQLCSWWRSLSTLSSDSFSSSVQSSVFPMYRFWNPSEMGGGRNQR